MLNKIVFFGNERLGTGLASDCPVLRALIATGYEITGVVVAQNKTGASRSGRTLEIVQLAEEHNIPVFAPAKLAEFGDDLAALGAEAGVLVAYGKIVPAAIIDLLPRGIINIHPSLLPKHRGPTPIESVILQGDRETGVSLMRLATKMDAGDVYAQQTVVLNGTETKASLAAQLLELGKDLLITHLPAILDGSLQPQAQSDELATYDSLIQKSDGRLDWQKPAVQLEREIRAYAGWPRSLTTVGNVDVIITAAHLVDGEGAAGSLWLEAGQLGFYTSAGILAIDELIPAGKKPMPATAFLAGYHP